MCKVSQFQRDGTINETLQEPECRNVTLNVVEEVWGNAVCANADGIPYPAPPPVQETTIKELEKAVAWLWHQRWALPVFQMPLCFHLGQFLLPPVNGLN